MDTPDTKVNRREAFGLSSAAFAAEDPDSEWSPSTDSGTVKPFKYSFALAQVA